MNQTIWVVHKLDGKYCISEIILTKEKLFQVLNDELVITSNKGTINMGHFIGMGVDAKQLVNYSEIIGILTGQEVFIIPVSNGN